MAFSNLQLSSPSLSTIALAVGVLLTLIFSLKLYRVRRYVRQLQREGLVSLGFPFGVI